LNRKVYNRRRHRAQRTRVLERDGFCCVDCGHLDETGASLVADHVHGIDADRVFADEELATRCLSCSGRKDGGRTQRRPGFLSVWSPAHPAPGPRAYCQTFAECCSGSRLPGFGSVATR